MTRAELLALAARVEAAKRPGRVLDAEVSAALRRLPEPYDGWPAYTASLDAALTLVPEGFDFRLFWQRGEHDELKRGIASVWRTGRLSAFNRYAATPALALTAAALRARAEEISDE